MWPGFVLAGSVFCENLQIYCIEGARHHPIMYIHCISCIQYTSSMSDKNKKNKSKDSQLVIRINKKERDEFVSLCEDLDTSAAREIRRFIRDFIKEQEN